MKVLLIGGTGLISTAITKQLLERGDDVTLYNRGKSEARIPDGAKFITGDRKQYAEFEKQMQDAGHFDCVMDMVGFAPDDAESVVRAFKGNIGHFIFCSTVCTYGGPAEHYPIRESDPQRPISGYGSNKVKCEQILLAAHERGDFPVTITRPSQTYGEGGTIVHSLGGSTTYLDRIRKGKPIVVHGDGNTLWAACHIDDVGRGFVGAAGNPVAFGKAYNLTGEEWMTWNRYHALVAEALNAPAPKIVHIPSDLLAKVAPKRANISVEIFQFPSIFDNSAAMKDLGFRYEITWVEGVKRTVAWLDERGKIENSDNDPLEDRLIAAWEKLGADITTELADLEK